MAAGRYHGRKRRRGAQSKPAIEPHPVSRTGCPGPPCERVSRLLGLLSRLTRLHHRGGEHGAPRGKSVLGELSSQNQAFL